jgi:hypothetical protein
MKLIVKNPFLLKVPNMNPWSYDGMRMRKEAYLSSSTRAISMPMQKTQSQNQQLMKQIFFSLIRPFLSAKGTNKE